MAVFRETFDLSARLVRIQTWLADHDSACPRPNRTVPGLTLRIDPTDVSPYPSSNPNRAVVAPGGEGWAPTSASECRARYIDAGVECFFLWLAPSETATSIESDVLRAGLVPYVATTYPVFARRTGIVRSRECAFDVRAFDPSTDSAAFASYPDVVARRRILAEPRGGREHFVAWDGARPVAVASLGVGERVGYLYGAGTLESDRGRGAQSALIALRARRAAELGCEWLLSETLGFLRTSVGNLERAGFQLAFEKRVFQPPIG